MLITVTVPLKQLKQNREPIYLVRRSVREQSVISKYNQDIMA